MTRICRARHFYGDGFDAEGYLEHFADKHPLREGQVIQELFCDLPVGHSEVGVFGVIEHHALTSDGGEVWWPGERVVIGKFEVED